MGLAVGLLIALPWHAWLFSRHGGRLCRRCWRLRDSGGSGSGAVGAASDAGAGECASGAVRGVSGGSEGDAFRGGRPLTVGGVFWFGWLAIAALVPASRRSPGPVLNLTLLVPLNLLTGEAMLDLAGRRIPARSLVWLAPATALAVAWWGIPELRRGLDNLIQQRGLDPSTALGLHLGLDLIVALALLTRASTAGLGGRTTGAGSFWAGFWARWWP